MRFPDLYRRDAHFKAMRPLGGLLICATLLATTLLAWLSPPAALAVDQPQMDTDELLKPLKDTHTQSRPNGTMLYGKAERQGPSPSQPPLKKPLVLTGKVQTLQEAIESEKDTVDWYAWYMSAREYLSRTGGLQCALGTPIKFYREGRIEAMTFDSICQASVAGRNFPLPRKTKLDALILPVRNGKAPPASPEELYSRINAFEKKQ